MIDKIKAKIAELDEFIQYHEKAKAEAVALADKAIAEAEKTKALYAELLVDAVEPEAPVAEVVHCVACDAICGPECTVADDDDEVKEIFYGVGA